MKTLMKTSLAAALLNIALLPGAALSYPNGTPNYVTDTGPFCASCHSAARTSYMPELPPDASARETPENKHYGLVRMPFLPSPYVELTKEQKERIIETARRIDSESRVSIEASSARVRPGGELKVTVRARGGNGPVIGVMLVDRALRFQARPVSSDGWLIASEPAVTGQDGKVQRKWAERRAKGLARNLNYMAIEDQRFDPDNGLYPEGSVAYTLKAPASPGSYPLAAVLLYGTEEASTAAFFQRPSGRVLFSEELKITVE